MNAFVMQDTIFSRLPENLYQTVFANNRNLHISRALPLKYWPTYSRALNIISLSREGCPATSSVQLSEREGKAAKTGFVDGRRQRTGQVEVEIILDVVRLQFRMENQRGDK